MQLPRDIQRSLTRYGEMLVEPDAPIRFTELGPGTVLRGGVVGGGVEEAREEDRFLLVEGSDGALHVVARTPEMLEHRD